MNKIIIIAVIVYLIYGFKYFRLFNFYSSQWNRSVSYFETIVVGGMWWIGWPIVAYLVRNDKKQAKKIREKRNEKNNIIF